MNRAQRRMVEQQIISQARKNVRANLRGRIIKPEYRDESLLAEKVRQEAAEALAALEEEVEVDDGND